MRAWGGGWSLGRMGGARLAVKEKTPPRGVLVNSRLNDAKLISRPKVAVRRCKKLRSQQTNGPFRSRKRRTHNAERASCKNETNLGIIRFHHFPTSSLPERLNPSIHTLWSSSSSCAPVLHFLWRWICTFSRSYREREKLTASWIIPVIFISLVTTPLRLARAGFFSSPKTGAIRSGMQRAESVGSILWMHFLNKILTYLELLEILSSEYTTDIKLFLYHTSLRKFDILNYLYKYLKYK